MRFLVDANLPRSAAQTIRDLGHDAVDVRDIGLGDADDSLIAAHAQKEQLALITLDGDFGDVRNYPPQNYAGLVVLSVPSDTPAKLIGAIIEGFLQRSDLIAKLPGRLAILEPGRVRIRTQ